MASEHRGCGQLLQAILDVSRDGRYCLTRSRLVTPLNTSELMRMKLDGTEVRRLSEPGGFNEPARDQKLFQHARGGIASRPGITFSVTLDCFLILG